jgi:predicted dehydrogenase (TIGR03970 family)
MTSDGFHLPIGADSPVVRRYRSRLADSPPVTADIVRGDCVGGSGAINGGYFWRALPADFEGPVVPGWSWTDVERHYRAVEDRIGARPVTTFSSPTAEFVESATAAGYGSQLAAVPLNIVDGHRRGPGAVFLEPALSRPNLTLLTKSRAVHVRFAGTRAIGVMVVGPSGPVDIDADQVVLSAGAVASAQLLLVSGIGPADDLRPLGIGVVADLPVGQRSADHPEWVLTAGWEAVRDKPVLEAVLSTGDLEIRPYTCGFGGQSPKVGVALMRPRARGRVSLVSADAVVPPRIEHHYDSVASDLAALRAGVAQVGEILGRAAEPAWSTSQHLCGTAPMGDDEHSVVDPQCRVRGVSGLSVIDGSALPRIPSRGPHATIAMIGHRAAEFVRGR